MMRKIFLITLLLLGILNAFSQQHLLDFRLTLLAGYSGPENVPFWLRSNQFGSLPPVGGSVGMIAGVEKDYNKGEDQKTGWGFGAEGRLNIGNPADFILTEGYAKFRYGIFEIKAGRVKEITGLCDTLLTSGSWSISGNAVGIPKIQLGIPEFYNLPILGRLFSIKGSYMHGWMGNWYIDQKYLPGTATYIHQKSLYGRFGKPNWKLKFYGGFNHQVVWGQEHETLGPDFELSPMRTFLYVNTGKAYTNGSINKTRLGDQLGSIDFALTYTFRKMGLFIYRQFVYDAGALYYLANLRDGLNGISISNSRIDVRQFEWKRFLVEFLYTKNQAGETWSPHTTSVYENYYNNAYYPAGWSYRGSGLGNPLISAPLTIKEELPATRWNSFDNNRVIALHAGLDIIIFHCDLKCKISYSRNFGTYLTSPDGKLFKGKNTEAEYGIFPVTDQFSTYIEAGKNLKNGYHIAVMGAMDSGGLYNDSYGLMGMISKSF